MQIIPVHIKITRRTALIFAMLSVCATTDSIAVTDALALRAENESKESFSRSGDDEFDQALIAELKNIVRIFEVNPGFQYINSNDAYATLSSVIPNTEGTVYLGLQLIKTLFEANDGGVSVAGICAHECSHIYQYKYELDAQLQRKDGSSRDLELHADFLAGYYMGKRKNFSESSVRKFASEMFKFGDINFTNPAHHGTPLRRAGAVERGYLTASDGMSLDEASKFGIGYVKQL